MDNEKEPRDDQETPEEPAWEAEGAESEETSEEEVWKVEGEESVDNMLDPRTPDKLGFDGEGMMIFTDQQGRRRRIPSERGAMSSPELRAAAEAMHRELGAPTMDYAKAAALERLSELRASGKFSEEDYQREKKRLEGLG